MLATLTREADGAWEREPDEDEADWEKRKELVLEELSDEETLQHYVCEVTVRTK